MTRLSAATLESVMPDVQLPSYDMNALRPGIVHLGLGAFHRAHQAVYTDAAIDRSGGNWGIVGVSLRSATVAEQLQPQDGLFSVMSEDENSSQVRVIGAVQKVLVVTEALPEVLDAIAQQDIAIVTLTVTEKGYTLAADGSSLDREDALVAADLAAPESPRSAVGILALGLRDRLSRGGAPLTILSCDNLSENSSRLQGVLSQYLHETFPQVLPWLAESVSFPCSMVDRIVPAMTPAQKERQWARLGVIDEGAVSTEPFSQWIIEDRFAAGRPDWPAVGVQLVDDILPFENIKLRLLNASHSAIAYCGMLSGLETVDRVVADPELRCYVEDLMQQDLMPVLDVPEGFDLAQYRDALLARFENPCLQHRCEQIAMDGSEKIPQRWLPTLLASAAPLMRRALSAWCYFVLCTNHVIDDPRRDRLYAQRSSVEGMASRIAAVLACAKLDADCMPGFAALCSGIEQDMSLVSEQGIRAMLAAGSS